MLVGILAAAVIAIVGLGWALRISRSGRPRQAVDPGNKAVLVTGCDTGFGHELARRLYDLGFIVYAACLDARGEGASKLETVDQTGRLVVVQMDVSKEDQVSNAVMTVTDQLNGSVELWAVVNNAGISTFGDVEFCSLDIYRRVAEVNLWGTIRVCKAFLPLVRKSKGRIVNVTSCLGRQAAKGRSCYVATKFALEGFTQCLRYEMNDWGVQVVIVEPGNYISATGIFTEAKIDRIRDEMWATMPEEVKNTYGEAFFKSRVERMRYFTSHGNSNVRPVVDAMVRAVTDVSPAVRYEPKTTYWHIRTFLMTIAPHQIGDYLYHSN